MVVRIEKRQRACRVRTSTHHHVRRVRPYGAVTPCAMWPAIPGFEPWNNLHGEKKRAEKSRVLLVVDVIAWKLGRANGHAMP